MDKSFIVIPSLNPDQKLISLIAALQSNAAYCGVAEIVVVNDGSGATFLPFFHAAAELGCTVLTHEENAGKGQALKTAFAYIQERCADQVRIVCADADGQHAVGDIFACLDAVTDNTLIVGCRNFNDHTIPLRSRIGNKVTRKVFKLLCGVSVSDTQTGLRAMNLDVMRRFLSVVGSRFEYEMNMLIEAGDLGVTIKEIPVNTIYIKENESSHFNPLLDSMRIYRVFAKFLLSSTIGFIVDITIFTLLVELLRTTFDAPIGILAATFFARISSSLLNFHINKSRVFPTKNISAKAPTHRPFLRYYTLCLAQMLCSGLLVNVGCLLIPLHESVVKLIVDTLLFIISFNIQREWVFLPKAKP